MHVLKNWRLKRPKPPRSSPTARLRLVAKRKGGIRERYDSHRSLALGSLHGLPVRPLSRGCALTLGDPMGRGRSRRPDPRPVLIVSCAGARARGSFYPRRTMIPGFTRHSLSTVLSVSAAVAIAASHGTMLRSATPRSMRASGKCGRGIGRAEVIRVAQLFLLTQPKARLACDCGTWPFA
jgi:hypothetical protein